MILACLTHVAAATTRPQAHARLGDPSRPRPWSDPSSLRSWRTIRTAPAFSSGVYRFVVGAPGVRSIPMTPSSFPRSGASNEPRAIQSASVRLMRVHGMAGRHRRRTCRATLPGPDGYTIPDLIGRRFAPGPPDVAWVQNITHIATREGGCASRRSLTSDRGD